MVPRRRREGEERSVSEQPYQHLDQPLSSLRSLSAGLTYGTLIGLLATLEPLVRFWGSFDYLGMPLGKVLAAYVLFWGIVGVLGGLLLSAIPRILGRPLTASWMHAVLFSGLGFLLVSLILVRNLAVKAFLRPYREQGFLPVLVALVVFAGLALVLRRSLARRAHAGRSQSGRISAGVSMLLMFTSVLIVISKGNVEALVAAGSGEDKPNVILVVLDALRADHLSCYGYERETSPHIDRLAQEGVTFLRVRSHGNRTILAMPALFTSLYPSINGAYGLRDVVVPLDESRTTIAEMLQENGYRTVGLMSNVFLKRSYGLIQGFETIEEFNAGVYSLSLFKVFHQLGIHRRPRDLAHISPSAETVADQALYWIRTLHSGPFFLYVHFMDTHHPYDPPEEFQKAFQSPESSGMDPAPLFTRTSQLVKAGHPEELSPEDLSQLIDYYDGTILYADSQIGRIADALRDLPEGRETIVIITADHGDEFLERGGLYHNNVLIQQLLHVPLIFWHSGGGLDGGRRVHSPVRHIDILPTLADLLDLDPPRETMGVSLEPLLEGAPDTLSTVSFAEGDYCYAVSLGDWKCMYVDSTETYSYYDISAGESTSAREVSPEADPILARLRGMLESYMARSRKLKQTRGGIADSATLKQLKALGYVQ
jgi:arylsulfatase A-like enzyme